MVFCSISSFLWLFLLSPSDLIFGRVYESRKDLLRVIIIGAERTPSLDGIIYCLDLYFSSYYPIVPPVSGWGYYIRITLRCCHFFMAASHSRSRVKSQIIQKCSLPPPCGCEWSSHYIIVSCWHFQTHRYVSLFLH
jgi:hypothetical protein